MSGTANKNYTEFCSYLLSAVAFSLPLSAHWATFFVVALIVSSVILGNRIFFLNNLKRNSTFVLCISYFVWHVIGLVYSNNNFYGLHDIETKLSFIVFPVIFSLIKFNDYHIKRVFRALVAGCEVALALCLINALLKFKLQQTPVVFFYTHFSKFLHPAYFSIYLTVAVIFLIGSAFDEAYFNKPFRMTFFFISLIVLEAGIVMLYSRMAILTALLIVVIFTIYKYKQNNKSSWLATIVFASLLVCILAQFKITDVYNRFKQLESVSVTSTQHNYTSDSINVKPVEYNSASSRVILWKHAANLWLSSPSTFVLGVGTGDIKDELRKNYEASGFEKGVTQNYNPHNQFLQTAVAVGIVGLLLLLTILVLPFLKSNNNKLILFFVGIFFFNGLTESILEVQSGIIFFCLFYCLLSANQFVSETET